MSKSRFNLYRYQLLPTDRYFQGDLYGITSLDELISKKNDIFYCAISGPYAFKSTSPETNVQKLFDDGEFILFQVAVNRVVKIETQDFDSKAIENWPKFLVAIWNHPDRQIIAVQRRNIAFQKPQSVVKVLAKSIEDTMTKHQLVMAWEPIVERRVFWNLVNLHQKNIKKVEFELITPNMASISKTLPQDLKDLAKKSNAVKSSVSLESASDSALVLSESDPVVRSLADYTSEGGGNVSITLIGMKKKIHTSATVREFEVSDAKLEGDPQAIASILKSLLE